MANAVRGHYPVLLVVLPVAFMLAGLLFAVLVDPYIRRKHRQIMLIIIALLATLIAQNVIDYLFELDGTHRLGRTILGIYGYSVRPVILIMFLYIVAEKRRFGLFWALAGVNGLIHLTALFSGICFSINDQSRFSRGPLGYRCHVVSGVLLLFLVLFSIQEYKRERKSETWIPIINALVIIAAVVADSTVSGNMQPLTFLTIAAVTCSLFYFIWLHLQFVREHERDLMAAQRIQIMMTQIQPHFLYNTLSTIEALCAEDPGKAAETTRKFALYLRQNIESLNLTGKIPFEKEMEHTLIYADIEMTRFPNIRLTQDIQDRAFTLPALTVQPLVENAIRHGVRIREKGVVEIATRRTREGHEIVIRDNGKGFDPESAKTSSGTHIGIANVRERIEQMCGGTLTIESRIGEGTTVTIRIPAQENNE